MKRFSSNLTGSRITSGLVNIILISFSILCIVPLVSLISVSFSDDLQINKLGYSLLPKGFTLNAYKYLLNTPKQIFNAYKVSIIVGILGTASSLLVTSGIAYVLSRNDYKYKRQLSFFSFLPMLFNAGLVPSYIVISNYLHLKNTIFVLILPYLVTPMFILILRTFMQKIPFDIIESCMVDGASEHRIFLQIVLPLAKPGLATISLFTLLTYWNDWWLAMLYIDKESLVPLQYMLARIMSNIEFLTSSTNTMPAGMKNVQIPTESARMAMSVLAAGPMLLIFPFFQKYFVKGLTIGSVKG